MRSWIAKRLNAACLTGVLTLMVGLEPATGAEGDYFETHVRPLFAEKCYSCHSTRAEKPKGGLLLDQISNVRRGGASGPLFEPGALETSLLIQSVHGKAKDLDVMPPKGERLTPAQIAVLEEWIRRGAVLPPDEPKTVAADAKSQHWAFRPPVTVPLPGGGNARNPVDAFLNQSLAAHDLKPAGKADRRTLLRRASFDLTGLPPTPEDVEQFVADTSSDAYERAVDRLLASPRYGERWARHWLDIARYADTKGYVFEEERRYPASYTYRDWVVAALNRDLPYDQFLISQIAGDSLATDADKSPLAALGFLTLGRRFLNNEADIIDDRLDVVFRGLQGLTIQCARCHDHKFDPIPIADYYSLYGVFASSREPDPKPLIGDNPNPVRSSEYLVEREKRTRERNDFQAEKVEQARRELRDRVGDYLLTAHESRAAGDKREEFIRSRKLSPAVVNRWQAWLDERASKSNDVFAAYFEFSRLGTNEFGARAGALGQELARRATSAAGLPPLVAALFATNAPTNFKDVCDRYAGLLKSVDAEWTAAVKTGGAERPKALPDTAKESLRQILYAENSPVSVDWDTAYRIVPTPDQQRYRALQRRVDELEATHPGAPLRAMALIDKDQPVEPVIFKRGNPNNPGPKVPRQFLSAILADRKPFTQGSGRLEMARAIASRDNPLTARVFINRVWGFHFGAPLVRTPTDFGVRTEPPTHPELLDWLAVWFMDQGWSMKQLHRLLLTSEAYQRRSDPEPGPEMVQNEARDVANTYLWKMNRKRTDFEALRDSLLFASGNLDLSIGGLAAEIYNENPANRRTLYGFIDRQNLPGVLRAFDFASPDTSASLRFQTTVPQQALYLLNSPFSANLARQFARRPEVRTAPTDAARVRQLFRIAYQRDPDATELQESLQFVTGPVKASERESAAVVWEYGLGRWDTNKMQVLDFRAFPHFTAGRWHPGAQFPVKDDRGHVSLTATGGHPGQSLASAVVRRWHVPYAGTYKIRGKVKHPAEVGDGVVARIVSGKSGVLGTFRARHGDASARLESVRLEAGDVLDFVVDCGDGDNSDSFEWSPEVVLSAGSGGVEGGRSTWNATADFRGPTPVERPLDAWERLAQALLASNEFVFVD